MINYKKYEQWYIGYSDIASLTLRSRNEVFTLDFGGDNSYNAYIVDENAEIGAHYNLVIEAENWLNVYDDEQLVAKFHAEEIKIYRAGDYGCVIQLIGKKKLFKDNLNKCTFKVDCKLQALPFDISACEAEVYQKYFK